MASDSVYTPKNYDNPAWGTGFRNPGTKKNTLVLMTNNFTKPELVRFKW